MELAKLKEELRKGEMERILKKLDWKSFENVTCEIFSEHGFKVKKNFRFKGKRWHEVDILAMKGKMVFLVECKKWRRSVRRDVITRQKERMREFENFLKRGLKKVFKDSTNPEIFSLIVTLLPQPFREERIFVIPIFALNTFLLEFC